MTLSAADVLIPLGIFLAEMCVVTFSTLRIIFIARGHRNLAPILGFFEVIIWLFAVGQTMQNLSNVGCFLGFAFGFTAGNYLGMVIEKKLAMGKVIVRVFSNRDVGNLMEELRAVNVGYTCVNGEGATGPVRILMIVVQRRRLGELIRLIESRQPKAFYAVDDLQSVSAGIFPLSATRRDRLQTSDVLKAPEVYLDADQARRAA